MEKTLRIAGVRVLCIAVGVLQAERDITEESRLVVKTIMGEISPKHLVWSQDQRHELVHAGEKERDFVHDQVEQWKCRKPNQKLSSARVSMSVPQSEKR